MLRNERIVFTAALSVLTVLTLALVSGQETAQGERDDLRRSLDEATSQPVPTVTKVVTTPGPVRTKIVTTPGPTVTVRATERANRSERISTPERLAGMKPGPILDINGNPIAPRKDRKLIAKYWGPAQQWAQRAKTRAVIFCESSNNPRKVSRTGKYRGLYQMDRDFWRSYGGRTLAPRPDLATRAAQNYVAYRGYVSHQRRIGNGWAPWDCA
jgi:hypothetical protein